MTTLLNGALVRARRLELGLSERRMAAMLGPGFSQTVVRNLEDGTNHADLGRVCDLLGLHLTDVLRSKDYIAQTPLGPRTRTDHLDGVVPRLSAALHELGMLVPVESLAATLDLTLDQVAAAIDVLDSRLEPAGRRVHRLKGAVKVVRRHDATTAAELRAHWRGQLARRGLDVAQVHLLRRAALGQVQKRLRNNERVKAGELVNAGLLQRTKSGGVALTSDVTYSLQLHGIDSPA